MSDTIDRVRPKPHHETRTEALDVLLRSITERCKLDAPNAFTAEINCPAELFAGLQTNRPELIRAATPRPLDVEQTKALYGLIATLIETNAAQREHAEQVSQLVVNWASAFKGLERIGYQIERFAAFKPLQDPDNETEA